MAQTVNVSDPSSFLPCVPCVLPARVFDLPLRSCLLGFAHRDLQLPQYQDRQRRWGALVALYSWIVPYPSHPSTCCVPALQDLQRQHQPDRLGQSFYSYAVGCEHRSQVSR